MLAKNVHDKGYFRNTLFALNYTAFYYVDKNVHDKGFSRNTSFVLNYTAFYYFGLERS
jgi:hypothetical protein